MSEQLPTHNLDTFINPEQMNGTISSGVLSRGEAVVLDASQDSFSLSSIGLSTEDNPTILGGAVVAKISDGLKGSEDEQDNGLDFAVVRIKELSGNDTYHIVSDKVDEDGKVKKNWIPLPKNIKFTIGRLDDGTQGQFIDGESMTGTEFSKGVSRNHLTIELSDDGLEITDTSTFHTNYEGIRSTEEKNWRKAATGVVGAEVQVEEVPVKSALIDSAPKSAEEAIRMLSESEEAIRRQIVEANAPRIAELQAKMDQIKAEVGEDQSQLLWNYGSYTEQRKGFIAKGDYDNDNNFRKYADEELAKMKPETAKYRNEYWAIMTEKFALEFPKI